MIRVFLKWWERQTTTWIVLFAVIQIIQIPHMIWNADLYLDAGYISRINPVFDFLFYGIDLLEIPTILIAILTIISRIGQK